jgi:hypothetical protein
MTSMDRSIRQSWLLVLAVALAVGGTIVGSISYVQSLSTRDSTQQTSTTLQNQQARDLLCIQAWAQATTMRAEALTRLAQPRNDALDALILAAIAGNKAKARALALVYKKVSVDYHRGVVENPPPPAPQFLCAQSLNPKVLHPTPAPRTSAPVTHRPTSPAAPKRTPAAPSSTPRTSSSFTRTNSIPTRAVTRTPLPSRITKKTTVTVSPSVPVTSKPPRGLLGPTLCAPLSPLGVGRLPVLCR